VGISTQDTVASVRIEEQSEALEELKTKAGKRKSYSYNVYGKADS